MKFILKWLVSIIAFFGLAPSAMASESMPYNSGKTVAQLVTSHDRALPGSDIHIAFSMRLEKHWHTYWRNAGGPGKPVKFNWTLPKGFEVGEIIWPLPQIVRTGPIVNYAFEDRLLLPMALQIPDTAQIGDQVYIESEALYLVCYQICLPESANLSVTIEIGEPIIDARWSANIKRSLKDAPKQNKDFSASAKMGEGQVLLNIKSTHLTAEKYKNPYFYPYVQDMIDANAPQASHQYKHGIQMALKPDWKLEDGLKEDLMGVIAFEVKTQEGWETQTAIVTASVKTPIDLGAPSTVTQQPTQPRSPLFWLGLLAIFLISIGFGVFLAKRHGKK